MITTFFFYGLAFIAMGIVIFIMPKRNDLLGLADDLWALGLFALLHGLNEWVDMFILRGEPFDLGMLKAMGNFLLPVSYIFLVIFSGRLILRCQPKLKWLKYLWVVCSLSWLLVYLYTRDFLIAGIAARYFICLPGTILSALSLYICFMRTDKASLPRIVYFSVYTAISSFIVYGVLSGLVVPKASFLFSNVINYPNFTNFFHLPVQFFRMLCAMIMSMSFFALIGVFSYKKGKVSLRGGIARKIAVIINCVLFMIVCFGVILGYSSGFNLLKNRVEDDFKRTADILAQEVSGKINEDLISLRVFVADPQLIEAVKNSNLHYLNMDSVSIGKFMADMDSQWIPAASDSPLVKKYLENAAGIELRRKHVVEKDVAEIFITDKFGGLVGASGKTSDFYQADEAWWQNAFFHGKGKDFVGDVELDESSNSLSITFALPIRGAQGEVIGVAKVVIDVREFLSFLSKLEIGKTGRVVLINEKGEIILREGIVPLSKKILSEEDLKKVLQGGVRFIIAPSVVDASIRRIKAFSGVRCPVLLERGIIWRIAVTQDAQEVLVPPLWQLVFQGGALLIILTILSFPLGFIIARIFVEPLKKLHSAVKMIGQGNLDYKIDVKTGDEIEELADAFKDMALAVKTREETISSQKAYINNIISSITDCLIVINPDASIRFVNKALVNLLGYSESELINSPVKKIILQEEEEEEEEEEIFGKYFQVIIDQAIAYNIGMTFISKHGKAIPVNFSGALMRQDGKIIGIVGVARDMRQIMKVIDDLKKKEEDLTRRNNDSIRMQRAMLHIMGDLKDTKDELERSNKQLQQAMIVKTEFTKTVSHELRTPLAAIKEGIGLVLEKLVGSLNEEQQEYLSIAKNNVDRLDRLISGVLNFQKLESGKMEFKMEYCDINALVKEVRQAMLALAKKNNLDFMLALDENLPQAKADCDKINEVLINLVNNAFKFTEKGGITIITSKVGDFIRVTVKDTGPGIKDEDLTKLFHEFTQLQRSTGGTGLGLAICKKIIEAHKGKIWAESELGKGSSFNFTLSIT